MMAYKHYYKTQQASFLILERELFLKNYPTCIVSSISVEALVMYNSFLPYCNIAPRPIANGVF